MIQHDIWMRRCFELALRGAGRVSPNPMVGAILVHRDRLIGEGWHQQYGGPHAEVHCFQSVAEADQPLIPESTLYCSLEPCSHYGKTPPCTNLILQKRPREVVVANVDPNPLVAGRGLQILQESGIAVTQGVLEEEGWWLNRYFFHWITRSKPYVILKWAQSADGLISMNGKRTAISQAPVRRLVHRWRATVDAILVGAGTAQVDDPQLDVRYYFGKSPLRILLDSAASTPTDRKLLADEHPTWIFGREQQGLEIQKRFFAADGPVHLTDLLETLKLENQAVLLVEGGAAVLNQFLAQGCWDELRVIENPVLLKAGVPAPAIPAGVARLQTQYKVGADEIKIYAHAHSLFIEKLMENTFTG